MLSKCIEFCGQFADNPNIRYKTCDNCIVVLQKEKDTITNEDRSVADSNYAKYRANKMKVICIFLKSDPMEQLQFVKNTVHKDHIIVYETGEIVTADSYDQCIDNVCSQGIHYFKSLEAAYYYLLENNDRYTGKMYWWYDNGAKLQEAHYINGTKHGILTEWHDNGYKSKEFNYEHGDINGTYITWYENGDICTTYEYVNGNIHGTFRMWYPNGNIKKEHNYVNGKRHGKWSEWSVDGNKENHLNYEHGKIHGTAIWWYDNGNKREEYEYVNGEPTGKYTRWYDGGSKS
jgi:antitoxin component YwqK of YwqJK toxin-antitoxin module